MHNKRSQFVEKWFLQIKAEDPGQLKTFFVHKIQKKRIYYVQLIWSSLLSSFKAFLSSKNNFATTKMVKKEEPFAATIRNIIF